MISGETEVNQFGDKFKQNSSAKFGGVQLKHRSTSFSTTELFQTCVGSGEILSSLAKHPLLRS